MVTPEHRNRIAAAVVFASVLIADPLLAQEDGPASAKGKSVDKTGKGYTAAFVIEPATKKKKGIRGGEPLHGYLPFNLASC